MIQTKKKGDVVGFEHPSGVAFEIPASAVRLNPGQLRSTPLAERLLDVEDTCVAVARHVTVDWEETVAGEHGPAALGRMGQALLVSVHRDRRQTGFVIVTCTELRETWVMLEDEFPPLEARRDQKLAH